MYAQRVEEKHAGSLFLVFVNSSPNSGLWIKWGAFPRCMRSIHRTKRMDTDRVVARAEHDDLVLVLLLPTIASAFLMSTNKRNVHE